MLHNNVFKINLLQKYKKYKFYSSNIIRHKNIIIKLDNIKHQIILIY